MRPLLFALLLLAGCDRAAPPAASPAASPGDAPKRPAPVDSPSGETLAFGPSSEPMSREWTLSVTRAASVLGAGCVGRISQEPQIVLRLDEPTDLSLEAAPIGSPLHDLSLVVLGADGWARCADDTDGLAPRFSGRLPAGTYQLFVGRQQAEGSLRVRLSLFAGLWDRRPAARIAKLPAPLLDGPQPTPLEAMAGGSSGGLRLAEGTSPGQLTGVAGGPREAARVGPGCAGFIADGPDHLLEVLEPMELTLRADAEADTMLVVVGPNGRVLCNDDLEGWTPAIRALFDRGLYQVFVGAHDQTRAPDYTLTVSR